MKQRSEHPPASIELVVTDKVGVVSLESIQYQGFVGFGDLEVGESTTVGEIQLSNHGLHGKSRKFRVHLDVDRLVGLDTDDKLVAGDILEDAGSDVLELNTDFGLLFVEG